jgi:hypothetical protein
VQQILDNLTSMMEPHPHLAGITCMGWNGLAVRACMTEAITQKIREVIRRLRKSQCHVMESVE